MSDTGGWVQALPLAELQARGTAIIQADRPVVLFWHADAVFAMDNRCPHMGFPLSRGSVRDGMVVCHWHHAHFDLRSGCTFAPFADDATAYETRVVDGAVQVRSTPRSDPRAYWRRRLEEGMDHALDLVIAKAVGALTAQGVASRELAGWAGRHAVGLRDTFSPGLVILTAMAHVAERVPGRTATLALAQGVARAAADASGRPPHRYLAPLERETLPPDDGERWLQRWVAVRDRDGAERTLATLLAVGTPVDRLAAAMGAALADRPYADAGHALDFSNKALELAVLMGTPDAAAAVLPTLVPLWTEARGAEESGSWRTPLDLIALLDGARRELPAAVRRGRGARWGGTVADLAEAVLGSDPETILRALVEAVESGATPRQAAMAVAQAAVLRVLQFGPSNEFSDWDTALHSFTYAHAALTMLERADAPRLLPAALAGALSVFQNRFLNVPPARPPRPQDLEGLPGAAGDLTQALLAAMDGHGAGELAVRLVCRYLQRELSPEPLLAALAEAVVREDAAFHTFQMLEAGIRLWERWQGAPAGHLALAAVARYAAAHAPTQRAFLQTVSVSERLARGESLHDAEVEAATLTPAQIAPIR